MKILYLGLLILLLSACGIDKETTVAPPQSSINNLGELDTTFNGNGYLSIGGSAGGSANDQIFDITVDSLDRVIAVGQSINGSGDSDMTVWRLTASGALDTTFDSDGVFVHDGAGGGSGNDIAYAVAVDSSDNIYVTGTSLNGGGDFDMVVWKLTSSGALDTTFNGTGVFTHDNAAGGNIHDQGSAITLDSTGRVLVAGFSDRVGSNRDMAVWRLTTNGALDTTFSLDNDGIFTHNNAAGGNDDDNGNAIAVDSAGNVIVVGRSTSAANLGDMAVWKLTDAGVLDSSFNGTGIFTHDGAAGFSGFDSAEDIAIDASGRYLITGYSRNTSGNNDMVIWKVLPTGALDTTFDADGVVISDVSSFVGGSTNDAGQGLILDSQGRIVVVGSGNSDMCVWRYTAAGALDTNFNSDGFFSHDSAAGGFAADGALGVVEDSFNRLYIGGQSENNSNDLDATFWRIK